MAEPIFREKLTPSIGFLIALTLALPMIGLALAPFGIEFAVITAALITTTLLILAIFLAPLVQVTASELQAGKFRIPRNALGDIEVIDESAVFAERGPRLDPRAQLLIRGDIRGLVKITIQDPQDPTPYLLLSTRRPAELLKSLS